MFAGWQTFYQLTGAAAAQLIGLLFIVATLARRRAAPPSEAGRRLFTSPAVMHLSLVLLISALALAPDGDHSLASLLMVAAALFGCAYTTPIGIHLARSKITTHWTDFWFYGATPVALYLVLAASCVAVVAALPHAAFATGLTLLALLLLSVRNAWDLVTFLAARQDAEEPLQR